MKFPPLPDGSFAYRSRFQPAHRSWSRRRIPELDAVSAFGAGLSEAPDSTLLAHAALSDRVVVTHDRKTMPGHAAIRIAEGLPVSGIFVIPRRLPLNQVVDDLEIIVTCSLENEWNNIVRYLPL
jgi:hypothetical protein